MSSRYLRLYDFDRIYRFITGALTRYLIEAHANRSSYVEACTECAHNFRHCARVFPIFVEIFCDILAVT